MKKNVIFISMHLPSMHVPEAGQKLVYKRLKKMSNDFNIHLISFVNELESSFFKPHDYDFCCSAHFYKITKMQRIKNIVLNYRLPYYIAARTDPRINSCISKIIMEYNITGFHVEYEQGIVFIPPHYLDKSTAVLHDVMSQSILRFQENADNAFSRFLFKWQFAKLVHFEKFFFKRIAKIIVLNKKDETLVNQLSFQQANVEIDYPGISEKFYLIKRNESLIEKGSLMFWGAMNRKENIDAVQYFVCKIFPLILNSCPSAKFYIVGANPPEKIKKLNSENIIVTGFVEDPIFIFERIQISVVSLLQGAGIKIKVLETLAAKIPTVSTSVGGEGVIDPDNLLHIADDPDKFARKVVDLINSNS
ncbi:glycosyltransferase family 4 protein [Klebsiella sp. 10982]|uniref:glycosyltransferase family 4 protein n=1 Tax=Klebsiella sp. 10982 TaxID=1196034 RepID=UPI00098345D8|nr:glycosyltransferase family 4 protein [Klebsiella sp. 10982]